MTEIIKTNNRIFGITSAWISFVLLMFYIPVTILGTISLKAPTDPISDPYFTIMEIIILLIVPFLLICMVNLHMYSKLEDKVYSLAALVFMILLALITSSVHFIILTVSRQIEDMGFSWAPLFFSFKWPSIVYALDILAWDLFFGLSMLFAAQVFKGDRLEHSLRTVMIISGIISLLGLIGVPLGNMTIRSIGIIGYTLVAAIAFFMMGIVFKRQSI
ncbi:hypothetical protein DSAG12_03816 [Promethearchaeum syntrophicum]|uniref:Uncharacterized protein n=1 Tax=Promethearchaeum syntrophicum TaxID=2594042 RepID=A0A5B9DFB8_9ARCH|nr:hypothetical protein [Candidatus Prometheoarchaeum syntrophicum]QEE17978.1 hypothetical protein DSAG12_03816 [Candidatus Prometheoarchaeum syntrophicum]